MKKTTLKSIKAQDAIDLTNLSPEACEELRAREHGFDKLEVSHGVNGMTGALLRGRESQQLYKITARCSNLFYFM